MCHFPSWIETPDGTALFLTDKDIKSLPQTFTKENLPGHSAIRAVYPQAEGIEKEGFPCHADIAKAIVAGQMRKMMVAGGYKEVHIDANGQLHREDGPAIEYANGDKYWYENDKLHRKDGPAIEWADGDKCWYENGQRHREDGPAIEYANGYKEWYKNGRLHRKDGPAIEWANGDKYWYENDKLHRKDGPAIERANGSKQWYENGVFRK